MILEKYKSGKYLQQDRYKSFLPEKINREWTWQDSEINILLEKANQSLGSLNRTEKMAGQTPAIYQLKWAYIFSYSEKYEVEY